MSKVIIHIGYPKCASTYLQQEVFPLVNSFSLVRHDGLLKYIIKTPEILYDVDIAKALAKKLFKNSKNIIISDEGLVLFESYGPNLDHRVSVCKRLHTLFPDAKILMNVRRQSNWLESWYKNLVRTGYCFTFQQFLRHCEKNFTFEGLDYFETYKLYKQMFSNVDILPVETISKDVLTKLIFKLCDVEVLLPEISKKNPGQSKIVTEILRNIYRYVPTKVQKTSSFTYNLLRYKCAPILEVMLTSGKNNNRYISKSINKQIMDRFNVSNKKLADASNVDLHILNY